MKAIRTATILFAIVLLQSNVSFGQGFEGGGGNVGQGDQGNGNFGADRVTSRDQIEDNRNSTNTGENNFTLGGNANPAQNNMNFLNQLLNATGANGNNASNQGNALRGRGIRAPFRIAFDFESTSAEVALKKLNARIVRLPRFKDSQVTAVLQNRTMVLLGEVKSQEQSRLAAQIAKFEPGVDTVKNMLTVTKK